MNGRERSDGVTVGLPDGVRASDWQAWPGIPFAETMRVVLPPLVGLDCIPLLGGTSLLLDLFPPGQIASLSRARLTVQHRWTLL